MGPWARRYFDDWFWDDIHLKTLPKYEQRFSKEEEEGMVRQLRDMLSPFVLSRGTDVIYSPCRGGERQGPAPQRGALRVRFSPEPRAADRVSGGLKKRQAYTVWAPLTAWQNKIYDWCLHKHPSKSHPTRGGAPGQGRTGGSVVPFPSDQ